MLLSPDASNLFLPILIEFISETKDKKSRKRKKDVKNITAWRNPGFPYLQFCDVLLLSCIAISKPAPRVHSLLLAWGKEFLQKGTHLCSSTAAYCARRKTGVCWDNWINGRMDGSIAKSAWDFSSLQPRSTQMCWHKPGVPIWIQSLCSRTWLTVWKYLFVSISSKGSWVWLGWSHRAIFSMYKWNCTLLSGIKWNRNCCHFLNSEPHKMTAKSE